MPKSLWLRREREPASGSMMGLRRRLLLLLGWLTIYGYPLSFLWLLQGGAPFAQGSILILAAVLLGALTILLRRGWPTWAGRAYVLGSLALAAAMVAVHRGPELVGLFVVVVFVSGLLGGAVLGLLTTACASVLMVFWLRWVAQVASMEVWLLLYGAACAVSLLVEQALRLSDHWEEELAIVQRDSIRRLRDRQGELNRTLKALGEAYAALKRTSDELVVARQAADEARALKEQFVANVSHELRTPLNLIVGFVEMMYLSPECYQGVQWTNDLQSDIQELYRASRHLQSLVDDVLDLSRIDASRLPLMRELEDVRVVVAEAAETLAPLFRQRRLYCRVEQPEDLPRLLIDRTRIRQVLLNLCNNAIRHTERGGITIRIAALAEAVQVSVCDTGAGIPADQLQHIFDQFHQVSGGSRRGGGAGLGLAISRQFVQLHGGRIWAESQVGVGSRFHFTLPLPGTLPESTPLYRVPPRRRDDIAAGPVIIVDPDPSTAEMIARYLDELPVMPARDVQAAEELVEAHHPSLVVVNQPPDTSPEEWVGALGERSRAYSVPIVRCSIPSPNWLRRTASFDGILTKPVARDTLLRVVARDNGRPATILVVDDYPGFVSMVTRMLAATGHAGRILAAYTGPQALAIAHEARPDLVLLDLLMPEMDGFEVLRQLRADPGLNGTRVVAVTATSFAEEAMDRLGSAFTISQSRGLTAGTVTELLRAALGIVRPKYA